MAVDIRTWFSSGDGAVQLGGYGPVGKLTGAASNGPIWKSLWRKLLKERRKMMFEPNVVVHPPYYDAYTYSQNFDKGSTSDDGSFSSRYADPASRIFQNLDCVEVM